MRRAITVILCAAMAAALTTGTASARAADPAKALAAQLKSGHGVHFRTVTAFHPDLGLKTRNYGDLQFGRSRVAASDVISTIESPLLEEIAKQFPPEASDALGIDFAKLTEPYETITVGKSSYTTGGLADEQLPPGKTWLKAPALAAAPGVGGLSIDILSPGQLKKLLATASSRTAGGTIDGVPTTRYSGSSRFDLVLVGKLTLKLNWKVWIGSDGLIRRVASNENFVVTFPKTKPVRLQIVTDTLITGWGDKVWIYAPDPWLTSPAVTPDWLAPKPVGVVNLGD